MCGETQEGGGPSGKGKIRGIGTLRTDRCVQSKKGGKYGGARPISWCGFQRLLCSPCCRAEIIFGRPAGEKEHQINTLAGEGGAELSLAENRLHPWRKIEGQKKTTKVDENIDINICYKNDRVHRKIEAPSTGRAGGFTVLLLLRQAPTPRREEGGPIPEMAP